MDFLVEATDFMTVHQNELFYFKFEIMSKLS